ncbi:MAG: TonB-dependent receptor [Bacteroidales bacterium]|nr:TonB-dependent receptor [Bacteroidales bacterium]
MAMLIVVFILSLIGFNTFSQETGNFAGQILEEDTGQPLPGANVKIAKNPSYGVAADINGRFNMEVPAGKYIFIVSYTGMKSDSINLEIVAGETISRIIKLKVFMSELSGVEIKVGRFDRQIEELTVSMEVILPDQIDARNTPDIKEILDYTPGLNILDGEPQIRGGSGFTFGVGSKVGVFIDGMPTLSGDAGRPYWELIPIENIKQIEVIKGASSVLSGASSLSGAIYIRTNSPGLKPSTKIKMYTGFYDKPRYDYMKWWGEIPLMSGIGFLHSRIENNTDIVVGGNLQYDHGYEGPPVTLPYVVDTVSDFTESQMKERRGGINFNLRHRNKKFPGFNYGINGNAMMEHSKLMIAWLDDSTGFYRAYPGAVSLQDRAIVYLDPFVNFYSKLGYKHSFRSRVLFNDNKMTNNQSNSSTVFYTDYNYQREYPSLNNLKFIGGFSTQSTWSHARLYSASGSPNNTLFNFSGYVEFEHKMFEVLTVTAGFRYEYFSLNGKEVDTKPIFRAGATLKVMQETYLRMSVGEGYRYPTIAERFISTNLGAFGVFANPNLVPETSVNAELGIKQGLKFSNFFGYLDIAAFQQDYENTIEYLFGFWNENYNTKPYAGFRFLNTGKSRIIGIDASITGKAQINEQIVMTTLVGYNYILPRSLEPDLVFANDYNPNGSTEYTFTNTSVNPEKDILKYRFIHTVKADLGLELYGFSPGISIKYFSKIENLDKAIEDFERVTNASGGTTQPVKYMDYFYEHNNGNLLLDARIGYTWNNKHKISVSSKNLTNRWYSLRPLKAEAMRSFIFQYSLTF